MGSLQEAEKTTGEQICAQCEQKIDEKTCSAKHTMLAASTTEHADQSLVLDQVPARRACTQGRTAARLRR